MTSKAQIKAQAKYDKANTVQITLKLNKKTDADIIEALESVSNKQGYIKELIREDLEMFKDYPTISYLSKATIRDYLNQL